MKYHIYVFSNGKIASHYKKAADEYIRRLSRYCSVKLIQLKKKKDWTRYWDKEQEKILVTAGKDSMTSEKFSSWLRDKEISTGGKMAFFIADEEGYPEDGLTGMGSGLNLSAFQMTPGMTGVVLLEQIYRGYRIMNGHPYHK